MPRYRRRARRLPPSDASLNISPEAARLAQRSEFSAAKGGVIRLSPKSIARENARFSITANASRPARDETECGRQASQNGWKTRSCGNDGLHLLGVWVAEEIAAAELSWLPIRRLHHRRDDRRSGGMGLGGLNRDTGETILRLRKVGVAIVADAGRSIGR